MNYDFIIYGGGLSSDIAALALARNNYKVCFIKNHSNQKIKSNLVTFLSLGSLNYLYSILDDPSDFYKYEDIKKIVCTLVSKQNNSNISFDDESNSSLGKILPNEIIQNALELSIQKSKNIQTMLKTKSLKTKIHADKVSIKIDNTSEIFSKIFILSTYDQSLMGSSNIKFISQDLNQTALSMNVEGDFKKQNHAFQIFTSKGPIAFLPFSKNLASLVWTLENNSSELSLQKNDLEKNVNNYFKTKIGPLNIIDIETHKLNFRFARKLYDKNMVIMGNIAHNIHPIAGQGLNLTIKDVSLFVKVISKYTSIGYELNNTLVLQEFDQLRKIDNAAYSFGTLTLDKILSSKNDIVRRVTGMGMLLMEKSKFAKKKIVSSATGANHFENL